MRSAITTHKTRFLGAAMLSAEGIERFASRQELTARERGTLRLGRQLFRGSGAELAAALEAWNVMLPDLYADRGMTARETILTFNVVGAMAETLVARRRAG
jgi:hypothetical protein